LNNSISILFLLKEGLVANFLGKSPIICKQAQMNMVTKALLVQAAYFF